MKLIELGGGNVPSVEDEEDVNDISLEVGIIEEEDVAHNHHEVDRKKVGPKLTAFLLLNAMIGAGILNVPYTFKQSGVVLGTFIFVFFGCLTWFSLVALIYTGRHANVWDYGQLAGKACGKKGETCIDFWTVLEGVGGCLGYLVIIGSNMASLLQFWCGTDESVWYTSYYFLTSLFFFLFIVPLTFIRQFGHFAWISVLSIASIGGVVLLVIIHGPTAGDEILQNFDTLAQSNCSESDILSINDTAVMAFQNVQCMDTVDNVIDMIQRSAFDVEACISKCLADELCSVVQVPANSVFFSSEVNPCVFCCADMDECGFEKNNFSSNSNISNVYVIGDDRDCEDVEQMSTAKLASAGVLAALGAAAFALGCQTAAFHAYNTLEDASLHSWVWVCAVGVGTGALLCLLTGYAGYFSFFNYVDGEILDSFPASDVPAQAFRLFLVVHLILYYPVHFAIMRHSLAKLFNLDVLQMPLKFYIPITLVPNLVCLGVVMATQQFYVIVDLTGGVGGALLYFIFPGILAIVVLQRKSNDINEEFEGEAKDTSPKDELRQKIILGAKIMVAFGTIVLLSTVIMTLICETSQGTDLHNNC